MGEYGLKIKNYEAASIYEYQYGFRNRLDETDAMLTNSLFLDFLKENGLSSWKDESTRDVVCVAFSYRTKGYAEMKDKDIPSLQEALNKNGEKCVEISKSDLRIKFYEEGFPITYRTYNKEGVVLKEETIHYKMLYRTPGKAKKGTCMFIRDELYDVAHDFLYMGLQLPEKNSPIVEAGAYASLVTSSIVGKVKIEPHQMLIVKDLPTTFNTKAVLVKTNERKECVAETVDNYNIDGEAFDGQALIDSSIFPEWGDGYVLLRHHFSKMAAFKTNIELFMRDQFGDQYETATITDMFGRGVAVRDIKLITTNNAIKWIKFGVGIDYWFDRVRENGCMFGIVKTAHASKLGDVQRMSYQMTNALNIDTMSDVTSASVEYVDKLKTDNEVFLDYLTRNTNFSNDYEVLVALVNHNPDFVRCDYFRDRKKKIIESYTLNLKGGRIIQKADNLTIVGSPYGMLLHSIGIDARTDPTFQVENGCIQCWTNAFDNDEYLAEFRSPFNSRNNLGYIHNIRHELLDRYFDFGKLILAVNTIDTDWQSRNNGADQDSDSCYTTNQPSIVTHAKYCYDNYPSIVNCIKPEKNIYDYSLKNYAIIDNTLAAAQLAIGQSSNLAQICLTYSYNFSDQKYYDYVCILSVLAQCAIDNAKRKFDIDLPNEIKRIESEMNVKENGLPLFWLLTKKDKRKARNDEERTKRRKENKEKIKSRINSKLICPMNYLYTLNFNKHRDSSSTLPIKDFFVNQQQDNDRRKSKKVEELIEKYSLKLSEIQKSDYDDEEEYLLLRNDFDELISDIQQIYISKNYQGLMCWLINRAFNIGSGVRSKQDVINSNLEKNKSLLMKVLYTVNKDVFLKCFIEKSVQQ